MAQNDDLGSLISLLNPYTKVWLGGDARRNNDFSYAGDPVSAHAPMPRISASLTRAMMCLQGKQRSWPTASFAPAFRSGPS